MGPEQIMLLLGLAVILIVVLAAVVGFLSGLKKSLGWLAFLLVFLGIIWIAFGNIDSIMNMNLPESLFNTLNSSLNISVSAKNIAEYAVGAAKALVPSLEEVLVEGSYALSTFMGVVSCALRAVLLIAGTLGVIVIALAVRILWFVLKWIYLGFYYLFKAIFKSKKKKVVAEEATASNPTEQAEVVDDRIVVTNDINSKINVATVSYSKNEVQPKKTKRRWWGAGVGVAKAALVLTLIFVPVSGIVSIASAVSPEGIKSLNELLYPDESTAKVEETNTMIDTVFDYVHAYENSFVGKLMNSSEYFFKDDISNLMFEGLLTVDTKHQSIVLPKEIVNYVNIFNALAPAYQDGVFDIWTYAETHDEEVQYAISLLKQSKLVIEIIPIAAEYAGTVPEVVKYLTDAGYEPSEIVRMLVDINWANDWSLICDALYTAIDLGDFTDESFDYLAMNETTLKEILTYVGSANFIREIMPVVLGVVMNLEQVKEFTGGAQVEFDTSNNNWASDLGSLADIYGAFKELGITDLNNVNMDTVEEILRDPSKSQSVLKLLGFVVGVEDGQERADLNLFTSVLLPIADVIVDEQLKKNSLEMFNGILSLTFEQYTDVNLKEAWYNDLATIVRLGQLAVELNAFSGNVSEMNIEDIETLKEIINAIFDIKIISGDVNYRDTVQDIKSALLTAAIEKFEFLKPGTDWSDINWLDEKDKLVGYKDANGETVKGVLDVYGDLIKLGTDLQKEQNLPENPFDIKNMKFNWDVLLSDENSRFIDYTLSLVEVFIDEPESNLFLHGFPNVVNKYIVPMLEEVDGEFGELPLFDTLTKEEILAEVNNLLSAIKDVALMKLTTDNPSIKVKVNNDAGEEVYALSDAFTRIINSKLLTYEATDTRDAADFRGRVIRIVLKLATPMDVGVKELDSTIVGGPIDYEGDISKINGLINTILDEVLDEEGILFDILFDENGNFQIDKDRLLDYLLDEHRVNGIIEALESIFGTYSLDGTRNNAPATLLSALAPALYHTYLVKALPEQYSSILNVYHYKENPNGSLTGFDLTSDVNKLLYVLTEAVDMGIIDFYNGGNMKDGNIEFNDQTIGNLKNILNTTTKLNILEDNFHDVIKQVLKDAKIEVRDETLERLDNEAFIDFINQLTVVDGALDNTLVSLQLMGINNLQDVKNFVKTDDLVGAILDKASNELLDHVCTVFEHIGSSKIVNAFLPGLIDYAADELLKQNIDITFLKGMSYEYMENEVVRIAGLLRDVIEANALDVILNKTIANLNRDAVDKLITDIFALHIVKGNEGNWMSFGLNIANDKANLGLDLSNVDFENIDWDKDVATLLSVIDEAFIIADELNINTMDDVNKVMELVKDFQNNVDTILTEANIDAIYALLKHVSEIEFISRILPVAVQYGMKVAPENVKVYLTPMGLENLTGEELSADISTVAEVYLIAVKEGTVLEYVKDTNNLDNFSLRNFDFIQKILIKLQELNMDVVQALPVALNKLVAMNTENVSISQEEFRHDLGVLANENGLLDSLEDIFYKLNVNTLGQLQAIEFNIDYLKEKLAITNFPKEVVSILDFADQMAMVNKLLSAGIDFAVDKLAATIDLSFLKGMSYETINGEVGRLAKVLYDLIDLGAVDVFVKGDLNLINESVFETFGSDLLNLALLKGFGGNYLLVGLDYINRLTKLELDLSVINVEGINWEHEVNSLVAVLHKAVDLIAALNINSLDEAKEFVSNIAQNYNSYITNEIVNIVVDIVDELVNFETVSRISPLGAQYVSKLIPAIGFVKGLTAEELTEDLLQVVVVLRNALEMGIVDFYNQGKLDGNIMLDQANINLANIFDVIGGLNTLVKYQDSWLQYAYEVIGNMFGFTYMEQISNYDFAQDVVTLKNIVTSALTVLVNDGFIDLNSIKTINNSTAQALANTETFNTVSEILNSLTAIVAVNNLLPNFVSFAVDQYLGGSLTYLKNLTKDEVLEDIKSVFAIVQTALAHPNMHIYVSNGLAGFIDFDIDVTNIAITAIENIFELNALKGHYGEVVEFALGKLNVPTKDIHFDLLDETIDKENLINVINLAHAVLVDANLQTFQQILAFTDIASLFTPANLERVNGVLNNIADVTLLNETLFPIVTTLVLPRLQEPYHTLADLESLYGDEVKLMDDLRSLGNIFIQLNDFGIYEILKNDGLIKYDHQALGNIINNLYGLNYLNLNDNAQKIISALSNAFGFELGGFDLASISFKADGENFVSYYYTYFAPILESPDFPIHRLSDLNSLDTNALISYLSREEIVNQLVDGFQKVFELPTVSAMIVISAVFALNYLPSPYIDLVNALNIKNLSPDQLGNDLTNLMQIILIAINDGTLEPGLNIYEIINNGVNNYVLPTNGITGLRQIVDLLFGLNMLVEPTDDLVEVIFTKFLTNIDTTSVDFRNTSVKELGDALRNTVDNLEIIVNKTGIVSIATLQDYYNNYVINLEIINQEEVLKAAYSIIREFVYTNTVAEFAYPLAKQFANNSLIPYGVDLTKYETLDIPEKEAFITDLKQVLEIFNKGHEFAFGNNGNIDYANTTLVNEIIDNLFGIRLLSLNKVGILNFVNEKFNLEFNGESIDLLADAKILKAAYEDVAATLASDANPVTSMGIILEFLRGGQIAYGDLINEDAINALLNALDKLVDMSLFGASAEGMIGLVERMNLPQVVKDILDIVDLRSYVAYEPNVSERVSEDLHEIIAVARKAVECGIVSSIRNYLVNGIDLNTVVANIDVETILPAIEMLLTKVVNLQLVADGKLNNIVTYFVKNYVSVDLGSIEFAKEVEIINSVLENVVALGTTNGLKLVGDYTNLPNTYGKFITDANAYALIDIVKELLTLQTFDVVTLNLYNNFIYGSFKVTDPRSEALLNLEALYGTNENLINEVVTILNAVQGLVDPSLKHGAAGIVYDYFANDVKSPLTEELTAKVADLIEVILNTNYVITNEKDAISIFFETTGLKDIVNTDVYISLNADRELLAKMVEGLLNVLVADDQYKYAVSYKEFNMNRFFNDMLYEESVLGVIDALEHATKSTVFRAAYIMGVDYLSQILVENFGSEYKGLLDASGMSYQAISKDYNAILNIVRTAVTNGALVDAKAILAENKPIQEVVNNMVVENYLPVVQEALRAVVGLNVLENKVPEIVEMFLSKYTDEQLDSVDFNNEVVIINNVLADLVALGSKNHLVTVNDYAGITNLLNTYVTDANAYDLIEIVKELLTLDTLDIVTLDIYNKLVVDKFAMTNPYLNELIKLSNVYNTNEALINEVTNVLTSLQGLVDETKVDFGAASVAADYLSNAKVSPITKELNAQIASFVETLLTTEFVKANNSPIFSFLLQVAKLTELENANIQVNFANDAAHLSKTIEGLLNILANNHYTKYITNLVKLDTKVLSNQLLTNEIVLNALDSLEVSADTTLFKAAYVLGVEILGKAISRNGAVELANLLDGSNLSLAQVKEDYVALFNVVRTAIEAGAIKSVRNVLVSGVDVSTVINDLIVKTYVPTVNEALTSIVNLNLVDGKLNRALEILLKDYVTVSLETVNVISDTAIINEQINAFVDLAMANGINKVRDYVAIKDTYGKYITDANAYAVIEIVERLLDLDLVKVTALNLYNNLYFNNLNFNEDGISSKTILDLESIYGTSEELIKELKVVLAAVKPAVSPQVEFGLASVINDALAKTAEAPVQTDLTKEVRNIVACVLGTKYIQATQNSIIDLVIKNTKLDTVITADEPIDLYSDREAIANAVEGLLNVLVETPHYKYVANFVEFKKNIFIDEILEKVYVNGIIDAVEKAIDTTLFRATYIYSVEYLARFINNKGNADLAKLISAEGMSQAQVKEDSVALIDVLRLAVEKGIVDDARLYLVNGMDIKSVIKQMNVSVYAPVMESALTNLVALHVLENKVDDIVTLYLKRYTTADLSSVDYKAEVVIINKAIEQIVALGEVNGLVTVNNYLSVKDFYISYINDENAYAAIEIINTLLELKTIELTALDLYNNALYTKLAYKNQFVLDMFNIENVYTNNTEFLQEVKVLLNNLINLVDSSKVEYGLADLYYDYKQATSKAPIQIDLVNELQKSLEAIFGTKYIGVKDTLIVEYILKQLKMDNIVAADLNIDMNVDAKDLAELIHATLSVLIASPDYQYLTQVRDILTTNGMKRLIKFLMIKENALVLINTLQSMPDATFVLAAARIGVDKLNTELIKHMATKDLIDTTNMTDQLYVEDIKTILNLAESIFTLDPKEDILEITRNANYVFDLDLNKYMPAIDDVMAALPVINLVKDNLGITTINVLDYVNVKFNMNICLTDAMKEEIKAIDFVTELALYNEVLHYIVTEYTGLVGVEGKLSIRNIDGILHSLKRDEYESDMVYSVTDVAIDAVDKLVESQLVHASGLALYDAVALKVANQIGKQTVRDFLTLPVSYNIDNFLGDAHKALTAGKALIHTNAYKAIYSKSYKHLPLATDTPVHLAVAIENLSATDFFSVDSNAKYVELVDIVSRLTKIEGLATIKDKFATVNVASDGQLVAALSQDLYDLYNQVDAYNWKGNLYLLGETELMQTVINLYAGLVNTESIKPVMELGINKYILPKLYQLTVDLGKPIESFNKELTAHTVEKISLEAVDVLNDLMAVGFFSNNGVNLANSEGTATRQEVINIAEFIVSNIKFSSKARTMIDSVVNNLYRLDTVGLDYTTMNIKNEVNVIKGFINTAKPILRDNKNFLKAKDLTSLFSIENQNNIENLYIIAMDSSAISQLALPVLNALYFSISTEYNFVVFDELDGITSSNFITEVISPLFEAGRLVSTAVSYDGAHYIFNADNMNNIKLAIDQIVNTKFINGGTTDNLDEILRRVVLSITKEHLSANVVAEDEIIVIKNLVTNLEELVRAGVYDGTLHSNLLLEQAGLNALANTLLTIKDSTLVYELTEWTMNKLYKNLPANIRDIAYDMVMNATVEELKADTVIAANAFSELALANVFVNGGINLELGAPTHLGNALETIFSMAMVEGFEADVYKLIVDKLELTSVDPNLDPVANINKAIETEGWSWANEISELAKLIRSLDGIIASGVDLTVDGKFSFENIMDCTDEAALELTLSFFNETRGFRDLIITVINTALESVDPSSLDINSFLSESLKTQLDTKTMASVSYWAPEMANLAHIFVSYKTIVTDINTMTANDADNLTEMLNIMNESKLFNINGVVDIINDQLVNLVPEGTNIRLTDTSAWTEESWTSEIVRINTLLKAIINLSDKTVDGIVNASEENLTNLFTAVNHSALVRTVLPALITGVVKDALTGNTDIVYADIVDTWLDNQVEGTMETVNVWDQEIVQLVTLVQLIKDPAIFDIKNAENFDSIKAALLAIKDAKSFNLSFLSTLISSALEPMIGTAKLGTMGNDDDSRWGDATSGEIVNLIAILDQAKANGAFDASFDLVNIEEAKLVTLLQTMNSSIIIRPTLPIVLYEKVNGLHPELVSDWLRTEYNNVTTNTELMSDVPTWNAEIVELAKVIVELNNLDMTSGTMNVSKVLGAINDSKSLDIDGIYPTLETVRAEMNVAKFGKVTYTNATEKHDNWAIEIAKIDSLITSLKELGIFGTDSKDLSEVLNGLSIDSLKGILNDLNNSVIFRLVLPQKVSESINATNGVDFLSSWLEAEQTTMSSIAIWAEEIDSLTYVLNELNTNSALVDSILSGEFEESNVYQMREIIIGMNRARSFDLNALVAPIQTVFNTISSITLTSNLNKEQWTEEIDTLFGQYTGSTQTKRGMITIMAGLNTITFETLQTNTDIASMLDLMNVSYIFKDHFNQFFRETMMKPEVNLYPNILSDKHLTDAKINKATANGWSSEISLLIKCVPGNASQTGQVIDELRKTALIGNDIDQLLFNVVQANGLDTYIGTEVEFKAIVNKVNTRIDNSLATPDTADDWSWEKEVNEIQQINSLTGIILSSTSTPAEIATATADLSHLFNTMDKENSLSASLITKFAADNGIIL